MNFDFHLVSLGECLVEFNRGQDGAFSPAFAGDAFNALFYAARLGLRTGFISALGDDLFTPMIRDGITREGIDTSRLLHLPGRRNGLYFIELDEHGEYTFHFWRSGSAATQTLLHHDPAGLARYISGADFLLLTGVGLAVLEGRERLLRLLADVHQSTRVVFDTNYRARLWNEPDEFRRSMEDVLPFVSVFLPTASDLRPLYPGMDMPALLRYFSGFGIGTIVVKTGPEGCLLWCDGVAMPVPPPSPAAIVDTTGAGDAFNAGFLAGLLRDMDLTECCLLGHHVAARALGVRGAIDHDFHYPQ